MGDASCMEVVDSTCKLTQQGYFIDLWILRHVCQNIGVWMPGSDDGRDGDSRIGGIDDPERFQIVVLQVEVHVLVLERFQHLCIHLCEWEMPASEEITLTAIHCETFGSSRLYNLRLLTTI